jgi:hypothetical protein
VPAGCRAAAREAFRSFGIVTSRWRPLPDFMIIGAHRAGTTSLHAALSRHPGIAPKFPRLQEIKGVRFFDEHFHRGSDWYRSHFATVAERKWLERRHGAPVLTGEASPYYLFHPLAAERAAALVPDARLIVLLRNPIDRAYSHWRRERRDGREPLETFEAALAAESDRLAGEAERIASDDRYYSYAHENYSYIAQGLYLEGLERWLARFPRERVCIQTTERFLADPQAVYRTIVRFLGLAPFPLDQPPLANTTPAAIPLSPQTRLELNARVAPHNRRLRESLGIDFGWDDDENSNPLHCGPGIPASGDHPAASAARCRPVPGEPVAYAAGAGCGHD